MEDIHNGPIKEASWLISLYLGQNTLNICFLQFFDATLVSPYYYSNILYSITDQVCLIHTEQTLRFWHIEASLRTLI